MKRNPKSFQIFATLALLAFCALPLSAGTRKIQVQGKLTNASGTPLSGAQTVTFKIYISSTGGSATWNSGSLSVTPSTGGFFNVALQDGTPSLDTITFDRSYFLGVTVGADAEMTPRQELGAASLAFGTSKDFNIAGRVAINQTGAGAEGVVITNDTNSKRLHLESSSTESEVRSENGDLKLHAADSSNIIFRLTGTEKARFDSNGNLGLGTSSPATKLDIAGALLISSSSTETAYHTGLQRLSSGDSILWYGGGTGGLRIKTGATGSGGDKVFVSAGGNVGIGTTSPAARLDIFGDVSFSTDSVEQVLYTGIQRVGVNSIFWYGGGPFGHLYFKRGSTGSGGDMAFVNSDGQIWSAVGFISGSSRTLKKNIVDSPYGLETVNALSPKRFQLKADKKGRQRLGFIAEEVAPILPEAVYYAVLSDGTNVLGLDYEKIIPVLVKAVQELSQENADLKKRIQTLENK